MQLLDFNSFYLVGIKGVAMTALAQCLKDAGKQVRGWDVAEQFVTQGLLDAIDLSIDTQSPLIPDGVDCVIYTAAHQGPANPLVVQAQEREITCLSHAEALADLFNQKQGIAVAGVGGKSTTSAMIAWILEKTGQRPSFAVGVGNIAGMNKTGQWIADSTYFVAEADEYVVDPSAPSRGEPIVPRFSFMKPAITICTNLEFDHPDVYRDFDHTLATYSQFFNQIRENGTLLMNSRNKPLLEKLQLKGDLKVEWFGLENADWTLGNVRTSPGLNEATLTYKQTDYQISLLLPGTYNLLNAVAAIAAANRAGVSIADGIVALKTFSSTMRRAEFVAEKQGVRYYDDYAHHPSEVRQVIHAFREWFPQNKLVVAFQSHTFSRTKALFSEFVTAFDEADEVVMIDIFASAREAFDESVTSDMLCDAINQRAGFAKAKNLKTVSALSEYLTDSLQAGDVCLTLGAGDIYHVHDMVKG